MAAGCRVHGIFLHQVRDDLGVGLSGKPMTFRDQVLLQAEVVLDNPVVYDHNSARTVAVRMGIFFGGASVGGPARVPDTIGTVERLQPDGLLQIAQLALGPAHLKSVRATGYRDSRRIVAAILQPPQSLEDDGNDTLLTDIADDATHRKASGGKFPSIPIPRGRIGTLRSRGWSALRGRSARPRLGHLHERCPGPA